MRQLMQDPETSPDGVFSVNDLMAIGVIRVARESGMRVPQDVAVEGFDDIPAAVLVTLALTTIRQFHFVCRKNCRAPYPRRCS